tara:strand:- start:397 stop:2595 length:2199 start_codon:yes stop_codon:yes gene_type:complete
MATTKITTPELFDLSTVNTALRLPNGSTATRPASPSQGEWRFNTDLKYVEFYDGSDWRQIDTETTCTTNTVDYPTTNRAYYKLDSTALDQTTNNKDGAPTDVTFYNGQQYSQGAVFNGSSSKIDLADNIIGAGTSSSSASIWFKSTSGNTAGDSECIIDAYNNSSAGWGLFMEPAYGGNPDGHLGLANYSLGGSSSYTSVSYRDGLWHHAVVVFDHGAKTLELFVDGNSTPVLSQTANVSPTNIFTTKSAIGYQNANPSYPRYFNGVLDQCRIFAVALTPDQISELYNEVQCPCTTDNNDNPTTNVAYYKLDGNANDSPSSAYNGTWGGTEAYAYGPYGIAGDFNGTNSVITVSSSLPWSSSFSISMWLRPASGLSGSGYYLPFMQKDYDSGVGGVGLAFYLYGYVLSPYIGDLGGSTYPNIFNTGTLTADTWNHVVLTRTYNVQWELFLNGASLGTYTTNGLTEDFSGSEYYFGANGYAIGVGGTPYYYPGQIDQVRIFSSALSATQVTSLYDEVYCNTVSKLDIFNEGTSSCLALYEFEDNADSTDSPTYDGIWSGTEAYGGGQYKKGGIFNGSTSYITIPSSISSTFTDEFSFSAWVYPTDNFNYNCIFSNGYGMEIYYYQGEFSLYSNDTNSGSSRNINNFATTTTSFSINTWHHVLLTFTKTSQSWYINGQAEGTNTTSSYTPYDENNPTLGYFSPTSLYYLSGRLDQVRIFDKALTATEALQVYTE